jgi:DNA polymerase-3 subunit beta
MACGVRGRARGQREVVHRTTRRVVFPLCTRGETGVHTVRHLRWANTRGCAQSTALITSITLCTSPSDAKGNAVKFRCEREALAEALATAGRAATGRTGALPVLSGLRLELSGNQLSVTGTDLDLTIQLSIEVGGDGDGGTVLPARLAADIVRSLGSGKVDVVAEAPTTSDQQRSFALHRAAAELRRLPEAGHRRPNSSVTLPPPQFGDRAAPGGACGQHRRGPPDPHRRDDDRRGRRPAHGGHRQLPPRRARPRRRSRCSPRPEGAGPRARPHRAAAPVGFGRDVTLRLGERDATFEVGSTRLTTRLIEGEFPNYRQLIPPATPTRSPSSASRCSRPSAA